MRTTTSRTDHPRRRPARTRMALVATAAIGLLLAMGAAPASAAPVDGEAFGLSANITVGAPLNLEVDVPPTPLVACPPDDAEEVASLTTPADLLTAGALNASCTTEDDVLAANATVADLNLADTITAELITAECTANGGVAGSSELVNLMIMGEAQEVAPDPNTVIEIPGVGTITLNRQTVTTDADGNETIVVEALVIELDITIPPAVPGADVPPELIDLIGMLPPELIALLPVGTVVDAEIIVASATCTAGPDDEVPPTTEAPPTSDPGGPGPTDPGPTDPGPTDPGDPGVPGTTAPAPPVGELPRTGSNSTGTMVGLGVALLAAGALSLAASRRRGAHTA